MGLVSHEPVRKIDARSTGNVGTSKDIGTFVSPCDGLGRAIAQVSDETTLLVIETDGSDANSVTYTLNGGTALAAGSHPPLYFPVREGYNYALQVGTAQTTGGYSFVVDVIKQ